MNVLELLRATRSDVSSTRQEAEHGIENLAATHSAKFLGCLLAIAADPTSSLDDAQSALLATKTAVNWHWGPEFEQFKGPIWSEEIKELVRAHLLEVLVSAKLKLVCSAAASVIARIGSLEYPDQWPNLVSETVQLISRDETLAAGLLLFKELLVDTLREDDFFAHGQLVLLRLEHAVRNQETVLIAIQCFHECINFFLMGDDDQLAVLEAIAADRIHEWIVIFENILMYNTEREVLFEVANTLRDVESAFRTVVVPQLPPLFTRIAYRLRDDVLQSTLDSDLAAELLDFMELCLRSKARDPLLQMFRDRKNLEEFAVLALQLASIPVELQALWTDDVNEFVTHEMELSVETWPRPAMGSLIGELHVPQLLDVLIDVTTSKTDWVSIESGLFLVSAVLQQVAIESQEVSDQKLQLLLQLVEQTTTPDMLSARSIITSGHMAKYLNERATMEAKKILISRAVLNPSQTYSALVRVAALCTLSIGCDIMPDVMRNDQLVLLKLIESLVEVAEDDTPMFLATCFESIVRLNYSIIGQYAEVFDIFFALAAKDTSSMELNGQVLAVVEEMLSHTKDNKELQMLILNKLLMLILKNVNAARANGFEYSNDLQFSLDLATVVFEHEHGVSPAERQHLLELFYELVVKCEDVQLLQTSSFAYAALLERGGSKTLSQSAAQKVLEVAARLLDPALDDTAALASGRLVTIIIDTFAEQLGAILQQLLKATANRLISAENVLLTESLTLVFCDLILRDAQAVVDFLAASDLLQPVVQKWLTAFEVVRGAEEICKNVKALETLFDLNDSRLEAITVNDKPMVDPNTILTRSKTRNMKFSQVPAPLGIIKALIKELSQSDSSSTKDPKSSDDDWDDELVIGDDGVQVDARTNRLILEWLEKVGRVNMRWFGKLNSQERKVLLRATSGR